MTRSLRFVRVSAEDSCSQIRNGKLQMQSVQQPKPISLSRGGDPESADCTTRLSRAPIWPTGARSFCHHLVQGSRSIYHPNGSPLFISGSCNRIKSRGGSPSVIADGFEKVAPPSTAFYRTKDWGEGYQDGSWASIPSVLSTDSKRRTTDRLTGIILSFAFQGGGFNF